MSGRMKVRRRENQVVGNSSGKKFRLCESHVV